MIAPRAIFISLALGFSLLAAQQSVSQEAPAGSCMLPTGEWCWPIAPLTFGDACECQMPDGTFEPGTVQ